jgi:hypothetical protein
VALSELKQLGQTVIIAIVDGGMLLGILCMPCSSMLDQLSLAIILFGAMRASDRTGSYGTCQLGMGTKHEVWF